MKSLYSAEWCIAQARLCVFFFVLSSICGRPAGCGLSSGRDLAGRSTEIAGGIYPYPGLGLIHCVGYTKTSQSRIDWEDRGAEENRRE